MPVVADAKEGTVDEWYKNEGDSFKTGDKLCTVTLDIGLTIAIDAPTSGILGEIYSTPGKAMKIDTPIAMFVEDSKQYFAYVEDQRVANIDQEKQAELEEIKVEENKKPDAKGLLREIKVLLQNGDINSDSPFAKTLQKLARQSNPDLVSIYEASCEGSDFDKKFFIQNAEDIVAEYEQNKTK
jgi:pyruvate/2-oxoglutarate dehydrogenase complex dihydrolipoamide acyltransferase (E2) component